MVTFWSSSLHAVKRLTLQIAGVVEQQATWLGGVWQAVKNYALYSVILLVLVLLIVRKVIS
jgi:hypothetical protein